MILLVDSSERCLDGSRHFCKSSSLIGNCIMQMKITTQQAEALLKARGLTYSARKAEKKRIFASIHTMFSIPRTTKFVLFIENPNNPLYCVLRDKRTKLPLDDGKPAPVVATPKAAPKAKPVKAAPKVKAPAKATKVAAKVAKAPAKATKVAAKPAKAAPKAPAKAKAPAAKKVAAKAPTKASKAPAKQVAKPAKKVAVKKPAAKAVAKKVAKK